MCNLYTNLTTHEAMRQLFDIAPQDSLLPDDWKPAPRIHPKQRAAVAYIRNGSLCLGEMQWGFLLPQVSKRTGLPILPKAVTNARDDKVLVSRFWLDSMRRQRCLVPSTAYCEFIGRAPAVNHWFGIAPGGENPEPFGFAGIWTVFDGMIRNERMRFETFAIVTTGPNEFMSSYHGRMPVVLAPEDYGKWLRAGVKDAAELLRPPPDSVMRLLATGDAPGL